MGFIEDFEEVCQHTEIPALFAKWTALVGLSAVLGRDVWLERGHFTLYPNFFAVLVAGSGSRKSASLDLLSTVFKGMAHPPRTVSQKSTPEALIEELKRFQHSPSGRVELRCEGFGMYDEITNLINRQNQERDLGTLLCSLYACKDSFEYATRKMGMEELENTYFGFLGASTLESLRDAFTESAIGNGLTSRMLFIYSEELPSPVAEPPDQRAAMRGMAKRLDGLATLEGPARLSNDARQAFKDDYEWAYYYHPFIGETSLRGYLGRRGDHLLKVALILAINRGGTLVVEGQDVARAIELLSDLENHMATTLNSISTSATGAAIDWVREVIRKEGEVKKSKLTRKAANRFYSAELNQILSTLQESGEVEMDVQPAEGSGRRGVVYKWTGP